MKPEHRLNIDPELLNKDNENTVMASLGIRFIEPLNGCLRATMPVDGRTKQPLGLLHGGSSVALAETLGSTAAYLLINRETQYSVGLEINANHIRAVRGGMVTGIATPIHVGRSTHVWDIRISDDEDRLVCISRLTMSIGQKRPKPMEAPE